MIRKFIALLLLGFCVSGVQSASGQIASSPPESASVSQVWLREADYWRFVQTGDVEGYVALWHDRFIGWPCDEDHPLRKASIGDWVRDLRDKHVHVESTLKREGAEDFDSIVVVHYRVARVNTYPDGKVEGKGKEVKITHTWMKVGDTWVIVGGMCGALTPATM
jgi:hypothetical protein